MPIGCIFAPEGEAGEAGEEGDAGDKGLVGGH